VRELCGVRVGAVDQERDFAPFERSGKVGVRGYVCGEASIAVPSRRMAGENEGEAPFARVGQGFFTMYYDNWRNGRMKSRRKDGEKEN
jgi:hypothetical protein